MKKELTNKIVLHNFLQLYMKDLNRGTTIEPCVGGWEPTIIFMPQFHPLVKKKTELVESDSAIPL
jgi:hypothetical protein